MRFIYLILLLNYLFLGTSIAVERSDAFHVRIYDRSVKVTGPSKHTRKTSVILDNRTLSEVRGKIIKQSGEVIKYVTIYPNKRVSIEFAIPKGETASFIPLAPAFQEIVLKFGKRSYEIPPKI